MQVALDNDTMLLETSPDELEIVRSLPSRRFNPVQLRWEAPYTIENYQHLLSCGIELDDIEAPDASGYLVSTAREGKLLLVKTPGGPGNVAKCKMIPDHRTWNGKLEGWVCKPTAANVAYLQHAFPDAVWDDEAQQHVDEIERKKKQAKDQLAEKESSALPDLDFAFHTKPFEHQERAFALSHDKEHYALLMEQGTGKTKVTIDTACSLFLEGEINAVLIVCPNGVKGTWTEDGIPLHAHPGIQHDIIYYSSYRTSQLRKDLLRVTTAPPDHRLRWLVMNVEAYSHKSGMTLGEQFLENNTCLWVIDESSRIKSPTSRRTKNVLRLRELAPYRRIMTGTPVDKPLDIFTQMKFLDPAILGYNSYYTFRNRYAVMGGYQGREIYGYQHLDEIENAIAPHSFRVLRDDCLDLPPKIYQKLHVDMAPEQKKLYDDMRTKMWLELENTERVTTTIVLTQMLRLQQITGGFVGGVTRDITDEMVDSMHENTGEDKDVIRERLLDETLCRPVPGPNPKLSALLDDIEENSTSDRGNIIWSRFRPEIALIASALRNKYGDEAVVEFHGGVSEDDREIARKRYQDPNDPCRFFVGNQVTAGIGLTLTNTDNVYYFSNTFRLEDRKQSEDRAYRIGTAHRVRYVDLVARGTKDAQIIRTLVNKQKDANKITGDRWKEWI